MSGQRLRYDPYDPFSDANIAGGPAIGSGRDSLDRGGQDYNNTTREGVSTSFFPSSSRNPPAIFEEPARKVQAAW